MSDEKFNDILDMDSTYDQGISKEVISYESQAVVPTTNDDEENFDYARQNSQEIIEVGKEAVKYAFSLAKQSDNPRAYEVLSTLLRTVSEANKGMIDIREKQKKMSVSQNPKSLTQNNSTVNNYNITAAEAMKMDTDDNEN